MGREGGCLASYLLALGLEGSRSNPCLLAPLGEHTPYFEDSLQNGVEKGRGATLAQAGQLVPVSQTPQPSAQDRVCLPPCPGAGPQQPADCLPTLTFAVVCQTLMFIMFPLEV